MIGRMYGLYVGWDEGIEKCSADCREKLTQIYESGVNFDGFTYPYFDSLLMTAETEPYSILFGTHSLLWDGDGRLEDSEAAEIGFDYRDILNFLTKDLYLPKEDELLLGGFEQLIAGSTQPWAIREFSRKFCSFCEHIARMDGVKVFGLTGGYAVAKVDNDEILAQIQEIYNAKTGGICRVLRSNAADLEEK